MKKYVQHISGQGEKWELRDCAYNENNNKKTWVINSGFDISSNCMELPRSEFKPCDPPEEWEDVTKQFGSNDICIHLSIDSAFLRVRKIDYFHNGPCFIVERKKS